MKLPTILDKSTLDMDKVAQELLDSGHFLQSETLERVKEWLESSSYDIYIFDKNEPGFESWSEEDYANNMTENHFEPYAIETEHYIVLHDYA